MQQSGQASAKPTAQSGCIGLLLNDFSFKSHGCKRFWEVSTVDDRNPALLVYEVYKWTCRISTVSGMSGNSRGTSNGCMLVDTSNEVCGEAVPPGEAMVRPSIKINGTYTLCPTVYPKELLGLDNSEPQGFTTLNFHIDYNMHSSCRSAL